MTEIDVAALPRRGFHLTGWRVLWMFVGFFLIVAGVDIAMATVAYRTFSGEVADDPYEAGRLYNHTLEEERAQAALGWRADVFLAADGRLQAQVKDRTGAPVRGLTLNAVLERPATEAGRRTFTLTASGPGRYGAALGRLRGAWDVRIESVDMALRPFRVEQRVLFQ